MSEDIIKVMLVDDHTLFRKGLAELLDGRDTIRVAAATGAPAEAARLLDEAQPDVLVLDLNMPPHGGLALLRELQGKGWSKPTLILTVSDAEDDLANAMRAGARGYLLKGAEQDEIVRAIQAAAAGEAIFGPEIAQRVIAHFATGTGSTSAAFPSLTEREREVLQLLAAGQGNASIAHALMISLKTVRNHVSNIFTKLQVTDRAAAIVKAREAGLASGS